MEETTIKVKSLTPILRIFDVSMAKDFYLNVLGFSLDWEHRYGENFPLYLQVSRGACKLHLSEHFGDSSPGIALRIEVEGIEYFHKTLLSKDYKYAKPGLEVADWGDTEIRLRDPFGNKLVFYENR
ncbi:glyoxalase family protein [Neobacillus bataviensis LMG 21833]|uniref:Bleomycin resistance protein n=1 Tax=Neobacillus bataviensis LMG 21833 TaxID=1117379 RepID=K6DAW6_9BACI|nr:glyoxalase superfamily protein [Neobacillus bataviensis]EKN65218.1 glyoxalase family protein [Neobacillus bataviensis LMG 21833]